MVRMCVLMLDFMRCVPFRLFILKRKVSAATSSSTTHGRCIEPPTKQQQAALLSPPRVGLHWTAKRTLGHNALKHTATMLSDAGTKPCKDQTHVGLLWTAKHTLGHNSLNVTATMLSDAGTKHLFSITATLLSLL
jgi:hypothetical protein